MNDKFGFINDMNILKSCMETDEKKELLYTFATYVYMSNPDYKYNETYLKDIIQTFFSDLDKFKAKIAFRDKLYNKIKAIKIPNLSIYQLCIQIDETWALEYKSTLSKNWDKVIIDNPNFNLVDAEKFYLKCQFCDSNGTLFSDYYESKKEDDLIEFANTAILIFTKKAEDNYNESGDKKQ